MKGLPCLSLLFWPIASAKESQWSHCYVKPLHMRKKDFSFTEQQVKFLNEYEELQTKLKQEFGGEMTTLFHMNIANSHVQIISTGLKVKKKKFNQFKSYFLFWSCFIPTQGLGIFIFFSIHRSAVSHKKPKFLQIFLFPMQVFSVKHQTWPQRVRKEAAPKHTQSIPLQFRQERKKQESTQSPDVRIFLFNLKQLQQCLSQPFWSQTNILQTVNSASSKQLWMVQSKPVQTLPEYNSKITEEWIEIRNWPQPFR